MRRTSLNPENMPGPLQVLYKQVFFISTVTL